MIKLKPVRSFVKRQRQLGVTKQRIFDAMWPKYGLKVTQNQITPATIFGRSVPITLEIGFGSGETIFSLAQKNPEQDFIGIEVYKPGIANLLGLIDKQPLHNIRIYNEDAVTVIQQCIPDTTLDKILILFPDPWPKKRHHKRRLIQPKFIEQVQKKLKLRGILHIATDWEDYASHITSVLTNNQKFTLLNPSSLLPHYYPRPVTTRFEQRGEKKGHRNFELLFVNSEL